MRIGQCVALTVALMLWVGKSVFATLKKDGEDVGLIPVHFCNEPLPLHQAHVSKHFLAALRTISRTSLTRTKSRVNLYFQTIEPILTNHHIPLDFKYLCILESGLQARATSSKGAHGYWQFMPETARAMGLVVNKKVDERRDLVKSTQAACRYFRHLYEQLGAWTLVAAAYNAGPGRVDDYMNRAHSMDYYDWKPNVETGQYLYRVVAIKELFTRPEKYYAIINGQRYVITQSVIKRPAKVEESLAQVPQVAVPVTNKKVVESTQPAPLPESPAPALPLPKVLFNETLVTKITESGTPQRGQLWVFEVTESRIFDTLQVEIGDRIYAEVEEFDAKNQHLFLRATRLYSPKRHELYHLPLMAVEPHRLGIAIPDTNTTEVRWKRP